MSQRNPDIHEYPNARPSVDIATLFDAALVTILPIASVVVYLLPTPIQHQLAFNASAPTVIAALTAPIVHVEQSHLLWNIFGYMTLIPLTYALMSLAGRRRLFRVVFVVATVGTPLLTSGAILLSNSDSLSGGLSGVLFVFVGFLPLALGMYLEEWFDISSSKVTGPLMQFLSIMVAMIMGMTALITDLPSSVFIPLGGALALGAIGIAFGWSRLVLSGPSAIDRIQEQQLFGDLAICAVALSFLLPLLLVSPLVGADSGSVGLVAHYVGYFMGTFTHLLFL